MRAFVALVSLSVLVCAAVATAQDQTVPDTPEELVQVAMDAVASGDWEAAVSTMHPDALNGIKDFLNQIFDMAHEEAGQDTTGEDPLDDVPPELREIVERRHEIPADSLLLALADFITTQAPMITQMFQDLHADPIGTVYEGDTLAHVVCRFSMNMMGVQTPSQVTVFSVKQSRKGWRMTLPAELEQYGQMMKQFMDLSKSGQFPFGGQSSDTGQ